MAFRHVTRCIPVGQQKSKIEVMLTYGVPASIVGAIAGFLAKGQFGAVAGFAGTIPLAAILGFCDWWFHYRLICIQDNQCAVGTVGLTAVSTGLTDPDLDFTINLVLAPVNKNSLLLAGDQIPLLPLPHSRFYQPQPGYPALAGVDKNNTVADGGSDPGTTALHCEIEGNGFETVCKVATVAAVVGAVAGTAAGAASGAAIAAGCAATGLFALVCLLIAAIVAAVVSALTSTAITGVGWVLGVGAGGDKGSPADVALEPGSGTVEIGDHVAIIGDWVFDNAHEGWHELHPVRSLIKLYCPQGTSVPGVDVEEPTSSRSLDAIEKNCLPILGSKRDQICQLLSQGTDPNVLIAQANPDNNPLTHNRLG